MTAAHTDAAGLVAHVVRHDRDVDVALTVGPAECVALIGPNGAGKSTVVDAVAGLLALDAGEVRSAGRLLAGPGRSVPAHRRRVGLVAQRPDLFPHRSVLANVAFGPRAAGRSGREARLTARQALTAVGVADLADRPPPGTLSGGQAQRVAIARALAADPAVVLLDEPTSALDLGARQEVRAALRSAVSDRPSLLVTHDPVEVMALADRVVVLEDGRVVEEGASRRCPRPTAQCLRGDVLRPRRPARHGDVGRTRAGPSHDDGRDRDRGRTRRRGRAGVGDAWRASRPCRVGRAPPDRRPRDPRRPGRDRAAADRDRTGAPRRPRPGTGRGTHGGPDARRGRGARADAWPAGPGARAAGRTHCVGAMTGPART
ncbi:ABC transporter ATP-binding protein [Curtobacterium sp. MCPF17_052]|uniref:ABC transporter ATP-binding protein n=1 Tax=Curtobacterium sp. MCPF17_052 TaxID=2175655 RepID=UPI0024DFFD85|nr:ATP-binding cassette domain-containing protein [Curtobacterium sp. MCPF17_052]WIB13347.1 ATP-binding cassette domain-containing protein [Curtobacterium sp. MCPF17_052]